MPRSWVSYAVLLECIVLKLPSSICTCRTSVYYTEHIQCHANTMHGNTRYKIMHVSMYILYDDIIELSKYCMHITTQHCTPHQSAPKYTPYHTTPERTTVHHPIIIMDITSYNQGWILHDLVGGGSCFIVKRCAPHTPRHRRPVNPSLITTPEQFTSPVPK